MKIATFNTERKYMAHGTVMVVGVDEVGRGPLAGPVVSAACVIKDVADFDIDGGGDGTWLLVRDSKLLSERQRMEAFQFVRERFYVGIGQSNPSTIDRINILQATFLAMKKAIVDLERNIDTAGAYTQVEQMIVLIDGSHVIPHFSREQVSVKRGDQVVKSIAAASIVAKVLRDNLMKKYDLKYPAYGFGEHKGYGTKVHMEALVKHGATPIHRKSFAPVKNVLVY